MNPSGLVGRGGWDGSLRARVGGMDPSGLVGWVRTGGEGWMGQIHREGGGREGSPRAGGGGFRVGSLVEDNMREWGGVP